MLQKAIEIKISAMNSQSSMHRPGKIAAKFDREIRCKVRPRKVRPKNVAKFAKKYCKNRPRNVGKVFKKFKPEPSELDHVGT